MDAAGIAWAGADVLADRAALVALFHWAHGARAELRIDARIVGTRTLALRLVPAKGRARAGSGAGEDWAGAYTSAETVAYPGLGGNHVRVVAYVRRHSRAACTGAALIGVDVRRTAHGRAHTH
jgi:hypothetical protein